MRVIYRPIDFNRIELKHPLFPRITPLDVGVVLVCVGVAGGGVEAGEDAVVVVLAPLLEGEVSAPDFDEGVLGILEEEVVHLGGGAVPVGLGDVLSRGDPFGRWDNFPDTGGRGKRQPTWYRGDLSEKPTTFFT